MLINLSNHPSASWSEDQKSAASVYGTIIDLPFPAVNPSSDTAEVSLLADKCMSEIRKHAAGEALTVIHLAGEYTLVYQLLERIRSLGMMAVTATSERMTEEKPDGTKLVRFRFVRFRNYFP